MRLCREVEESSQPREASTVAIEEIEAAFNERVQFVVDLPKEYHQAQQLILTQQNKNQRIRARAARLATEIKKKRAIIQHLRDGRKHSYWLHSLLGALPKIFQRRSKKMKDTQLRERAAVRLTDGARRNDVDWRT